MVEREVLLGPGAEGEEQDEAEVDEEEVIEGLHVMATLSMYILYILRTSVLCTVDKTTLLLTRLSMRD